MQDRDTRNMTPSQAETLEVLDTILGDFALHRDSHGSVVDFTGDRPKPSTVKGDKLDLTLIGAVPALANAVAATQIYEARGGRPQKIEVDLRRGHNYIDSDIGTTPTINGQVSALPANLERKMCHRE